jgi:aspartate-semialdehyde dehydrogenase
LNAAGIRLTLIGADEPVGEALCEELGERDLAIAELTPVSLAEAEGCVSYRGEDIPCLSLDQLNWDRTDLVVMAVAGPAVQRLGKAALERGCPVVGTKQALPVGVGTGENPAYPVMDASASAILRVLGPIANGYGLSAVSGFVGLPVAARGKEGIEELANQSRGLLALESPEPEVFPVQIAFNLIPQVGGNETEATEFESDLQEILGLSLGQSLRIQITAAWLPTFYGGVAALHGISESPITIKEIQKTFDKVPDITIMDTHMPGGVPTPVTDAVGSGAVFIGRLKVDPHDDNCFSIWLAFDQPRLQAAQILDAVEKLIERKMSSVLT